MAKTEGSVRCHSGFVIANKLDKKGDVTRRAITVKGGDILPGDHWIAQTYAQHFESVSNDTAERIERMTATPGERRKLSTRRGVEVMKAAGKRGGKAAADPLAESEPAASESEQSDEADEGADSSESEE